MIYPKALIQEAVFDIRVNKVKNIDLESYIALANHELKDYSNVEKKFTLTSKLKFDSKKQDLSTENKKKNFTGVVFSKDDDNIKIQFRKDGFTLNMLKPYSNWDEFSSLAYKYWDVYRESIKPANISRIALRYINRIELPLQDLKFDTYFKSIPKLPSVFENSYQDFLIRTVSRSRKSGNPAILIRRIDKPENTFLPFIIDIDVYKDKNINQSNIKKDFEVMREDKNDIFESLITDELRKSFK